MKLDIYFYAMSAVICFIMAFAIAVGDLPHNWLRTWMGIPIGVIVGYAEIVMGIVCGAFLTLRGIRRPHER